MLSKVSKSLQKSAQLKYFITNELAMPPSGQMTVREALQTAMFQELKRDERVFLMGEEVAQYLGAYKVSKGLFDEFGSRRVWDTPITEQGFTGLGIGAAMHGLKPVIEFMTWNFALQAVDQIMNSAAKSHYMSGGELNCPIVFRGLNGPAAAVAAQHSQCFAAMYANVPGHKVVAIYDSEDARGMLKASIRDPSPVIFLENELMYGQSFPVTEEMLGDDFLIPLNKAKIMRKGEHITFTAFSRMVGVALEAAEILQKEGISCEVINLRCIRPLDRQTIIDSVKKTSRLVTIEDGYPQHGVGSEICAVVMESDAFNYLDAPVERVTAWDIPLPYSQTMERASLPQVENILKAARNAVNGVRL